jgi:hypothetical protein
VHRRGRGGKEVSGEFIVTRGDAAPVFDAAEIVFDFVAPSVKAFGTIGFSGGIAAAGDDRQSSLILDLLTYFLAVVGLVGCNSQRWAFMIVLSIRYSLSRDFAASVSKICFQMPRRDQRLKRL